MGYGPEIKEYSDCRICPRECGADRNAGSYGYCMSSALPRIAQYGAHRWEEPPISGTKGSGTVFFSGCNLKCIYCQNMEISRIETGLQVDVDRLISIFLELGRNCHNINLVTSAHFLPTVIRAILGAKEKGLSVPIVYNTSSYEKLSAIKALKGLVDIYLPDIKYRSSRLGKVLSNAPDYFDVASAAVVEMLDQVGHLAIDSEGIARKGLLIRHLVIPGETEDSFRVLEWIRDNVGKYAHLSIMSQYTPEYVREKESPYARRVSPQEYEAVLDKAVDLGLCNVFTQDISSSSTAYVPEFDQLRR
ncbi:MAG TPA: radical SAM protein [Bacillota bacterium]|nr:radical SAM protein [Bacillota bacterium]